MTARPAGVMRVSTPGMAQPCIIPLPPAPGQQSAAAPADEARPVQTDTPPAGNSMLDSEQRQSTVFAASSYSAAEVAGGAQRAQRAAVPGGGGGGGPASVAATDEFPDDLSEAGSLTGSHVSASGLSYSGSMQGSFTSTGSGRRAHFNAAMWPGRASMHSDRCLPPSTAILSSVHAFTCMSPASDDAPPASFSNHPVHGKE